MSYFVFNGSTTPLNVKRKFERHQSLTQSGLRTYLLLISQKARLVKTFRTIDRKGSSRAILTTKVSIT